MARNFWQRIKTPDGDVTVHVNRGEAKGKWTAKDAAALSAIVGAAAKQLFPPNPSPEGNVVTDTYNHYEALCAEFYRETGIFAPGKDVPAAMGSALTPEERLEYFDEWCRQRPKADPAASSSGSVPHG